MTPPKTPEQLAEERAKRCIQERGVPHWHDLRDMYLEGFRAGQEQMNEACAVEAEEHGHGYSNPDSCLAAIKISKRIRALLKPEVRE